MELEPDLAAELTESERWAQIVNWAEANSLFIGNATVDQTPQDPPAAWAYPWGAILRDLADHDTCPDQVWLNVMADWYDANQTKKYSKPVRLPKLVSFQSDTTIAHHERIEGGYIPVGANVYLPPGEYVWDWDRQETVRLDIIKSFDPITYLQTQALTAGVSRDDLLKASTVSHSARIAAVLRSRVVQSYVAVGLVLLMLALLVHNL